MRFVAFVVAMLAGFALAQTQPVTPQSCAGKCNLPASECMKACVKDPKDAQRPDAGHSLVECMKVCDVALKQCKSTCSEK